MAIADISTVTDPSWRAEAACADIDPEIFYPERGESTWPAKQVCHSCPVERQCLEYALATNQQFGVWGGKSHRERRKIRQIRLGIQPRHESVDLPSAS